MNFREWIAENIGYRFFGCFYNRTHDSLFEFIETKIPNNFIGRSIADLGCGDGTNTIRVRRVFKAKNVVGYDHNDYLLEKAKKQGLKVKKIDLNKNIPEGELASFTFSLHHIKDKKKALRKAVKNFDYVFLCEPIKDLYHALFDAGQPLKKHEWIKLFDRVFKKYILYQYKNNLVVFYPCQ